jgi:hypothetical protein
MNVHRAKCIRPILRNNRAIILIEAFTDVRISVDVAYLR